MSDSAVPTIVETIPANAETDIDTTTAISIQLDTPMAERGAVDLVALTAGVDDRRSVDASTGNWDSEYVWTWHLGRPLRSEVEYEVTGQAFESVDGLPLEPFSFRFTTRDDRPPEVVSSAPEEGASDAPRSCELQRRFSEAIVAGQVALDLRGGSGTIEDVMTVGDTVSAMVTGLSHDTEYSIRVAQVLDLAGNRFNGMPYLQDSQLDFRTGPDRDGPVVVAAMPAEGALDVNSDQLTSVTLEFSETMDTSIVSATLDNGEELFVLQGGAWSQAGRVITLPVSREWFGYQALHRVDVTGFRDAVGNPVDGTPYLNDGWLDFTTGEDSFPPAVLSAIPGEGAQAVDPYLNNIEVHFSEAMDPSVVTAILTTPDGPVELQGTWQSGDTIVTFDASGVLVAGMSYSLDLSSMRDTTGNSLVEPEATLGNLSLNFETRPGTGENCREALTVDEAGLVNGRYGWFASAGSVGVADGAGIACDIDGVGPDFYVVYEKTSDTMANGGAVLEVTATSTGGAPLNLSVLDQCGVPGAELSCLSGQSAPKRYADLGPGRYYIAVSVEDSEAVFPNVSLSVEETSTAPDGENCLNPWDDQSATRTFPGQWNVPADAAQVMDLQPVTGVGGPWCAVNGTRQRLLGPDMVFEIPTPGPGMTVEVTTTGPAIVSVTDACGGSAQTRACQLVDGTEIIFALSPGPTAYVWVSAPDPGDVLPGVHVKDLDLQIGCDGSWGAPETLQVGDNNVVLGTPYSAPMHCIDERDGGVYGGARKWAMFTAPTDGVLEVSGADAGPLVIRDEQTGENLACVLEADARGVSAEMYAGQELCVYFVSSTWTGGQSTLHVDFTPGSIGSTSTILPSEAGVLSGSSVPFVDADWLAAESGVVHLGSNSLGAVSTVPNAMATTADIRAAGDDPLFGNTGLDGVTDNGGALFTVDDVTSTTEARVYRMWDGLAATWSPSVWDSSPRAYSPFQSRAVAFDGSNVILATHQSTGGSTFFSVPSNVSAPPGTLGSNDQIQNIVALAADGSFMYMLGTVSAVWSVYRLSRAELSNPSAIPLRIGAVFDAPIEMKGGMVLDETTNPDHLYLRFPTLPGVQAIWRPGATVPAWMGQVTETGALGPPWDLAWDGALNALFAVSADRHPEGRIVRVE